MTKKDPKNQKILLTMKTLQNNYTTPEQSKRLLEAGLPAESADCYYGALGFGNGYHKYPSICWSDGFSGNIDIPCWSVGRLVEILQILDASPDFVFHRPDVEKDGGYAGYLVRVIDDWSGLWNFSKLESR